MSRGRRPIQQRGRERREALLRAANELLGEGGAKAVTHRAVAARAGLPLASTTYYFDSIQQLTEEALMLQVAERVVELEALADVAEFAGRSAEEFAAQFVTALVARPARDLVAQYEVYLEASRNTDLRRSVADSMAGFERLAARALGALGARDPDQSAMAIVALLDGFALHRVARPLPTAVEVDAIVAALRALFIAQVVDPAELQRWHERLRQPIPDPAGAAP
ncbi:MAG: TetR/AcrR family transcriptional regulator [Acidimicrobiales bacterium]